MTDRIAAIEAELRRLRTPTVHPQPQPTGFAARLAEQHDAARQRRVRQAEADAARARQQAERERPKREQRDKELVKADAAIEAVRTEARALNARADEMWREREALRNAPL